MKAKSDLRKKMSVIASSGVDGDDEDLRLSQKLWDKVRQKGFDGVADKTDSEDSSELESGSEDDGEEDSAEDSDDSIDSKQERIEEMAFELE